MAKFQKIAELHLPDLKINGTERTWLNGVFVKKETLAQWNKMQRTETRADVKELVTPALSNFGDYDFKAIVNSPLEVESFIARCREHIPKLTKKQRKSVKATLAQIEARVESSGDDPKNSQIISGIMSAVWGKIKSFSGE